MCRLLCLCCISWVISYLGKWRFCWKKNLSAKINFPKYGVTQHTHSIGSTHTTTFVFLDESTSSKADQIFYSFNRFMHYSSLYTIYVQNFDIFSNKISYVDHLKPEIRMKIKAKVVFAMSARHIINI